MKRILINKSLTDELRIALVDGARLFDLDSETNEIKIQVPPFIESGDEILVDTRTIEYIKKL